MSTALPSFGDRSGPATYISVGSDLAVFGGCGHEHCDGRGIPMKCLDDVDTICRPSSK